MKLYKEDYELKEDEYLLKIRQDSEANNDAINSGFLTKFNKNGSMPAAFKEWGITGYSTKLNGEHYWKQTEMPEIHVFKEIFRSGWKLDSWRFGLSRNWASLVHPKGFTVEIHLENFLDIVKENTIINGEIQGEFKWVYSNLIKK